MKYETTRSNYFLSCLLIFHQSQLAVYGEIAVTYFRNAVTLFSWRCLRTEFFLTFLRSGIIFWLGKCQIYDQTKIFKVRSMSAQQLFHWYNSNIRGSLKPSVLGWNFLSEFSIFHSRLFCSFRLLKPVSVVIEFSL